MNLKEDLLEAADDVLFNTHGKHLDDVQTMIFQGSLEGKAYKQMCKKCEYNEQHLKNKGAELWKLLSDPLGEKVTKKNCKSVLERYQRDKSLHKQEDEVNIDTRDIRKKVKSYYKKRHGDLKVLGMPKSVKLKSVYTEVQFLNNETISSYESIENLERNYRQADRRKFQFQDEDKLEGIKVANDEQYLMVLGGPGAGKSTFLRKMGLEALKGEKGEFKHTCIPIFIELKTFISSDVNIKDFIVEEFKTCGLPEPNKFTAKALEEGKLLILFDGLDEVPTKNSPNVIEQIKYFVDTYDKNHFIASCRVAAYRNNFQRFTDVVMADFDDIQIKKFIKNWFCSEPDVGKDCWEKLNSSEYTAAKELTQTPLLLTLVCLFYQRSKKIPTNRATLYEKALRVLLEEWAGEKNLPQEDLYRGLDTKRKETLLSEIAHDAFQEDRLFLPQREIVDKIKNLLAEMLPDEKSINGENVLKSIEVQHGVLVKRANNIYSFSHLTLQEYLTAQYIDAHHQIKKLVTEHLTDQRWKEVFLLVAGLMVAGLMRSGADDLLLSMEKEAQKYINTPKLQALLNWVEQATTGSAEDLKPVGKRATALIIAYAFANAEANANANAEANAIVNAKAYAFAEACDIANTKVYAYAKAYAYAIAFAYANANAIAIAEAEAYVITEAINYTRKLEELTIFNNVNFTMLINKLNELKTKIFDEKQPHEVHLAFLQCLQKTLLNAFNLSSDIINLSKEEIKALENYFSANNLLIQCKKASMRLSLQTWEAIEARMFTTVVAPID